MILFLEDLKALLLEIDTHHEEDQNEILIEVIDLIDNKIIELEIYSNKDYLSERKIYNLFAKSKKFCRSWR